MIAIHDPRLLDTLERLDAAWQGMVWRQVIGYADPYEPIPEELGGIPLTPRRCIVL